MPQDNPGGLSPQETADIIAYVLQVNKAPSGGGDLPSESAALGAVAMTKGQ